MPAGLRAATACVLAASLWAGCLDGGKGEGRPDAGGPIAVPAFSALPVGVGVGMDPSSPCHAAGGGMAGARAGGGETDQRAAPATAAGAPAAQVAGTAVELSVPARRDAPTTATIK